MVGKAIGGGTFAGAKTPAPRQLARVADKFIYHSGTVDQLDDMKWGLEPQHGDWIRELAQHAGDIEPDELLEQSTPLVWMSDKPSWVAMKVARKLKKHPHDVTDDEIRQHGHVAMVPRKGDHAEHVWHVGEEGLLNGEYSPVTNLKGETKKAGWTDLYQNDWSGNKQPFGVERNEYVSAQPVEPMFHLTGQDLVDFLHASGNRPVKAEGGEVSEPGITAYHGSPHDFERFDMSKIGTGEGAQAYGHGLYFAENPAVAKSYRPIASENRPVPIIVDGQKFENPTAMQKLVAKHRGNVDAVHKVMSPHWERAALEFQSAPQDPDDLGYMLAEAEHQQALAQKAELEELRGKKVEHDYSGHHEGHALAGHSYEVRINAHPDHFLDWDKPLKDQHEHVQKAIRSLPYGNIKWLEDTPNLYAALEDARSSWMQQQGHDTRGYQKHKVGVSDDLRQAGLPGVKYLDQGSVNAAHKGTRNYVVFDDKLVNVKRKYAKGGSVNEYPLDDDADEHLHSGGHMTWMSPDSFLNKAEEMRGDSDDKKAIKHFEKRIEEGDKLNPLALYPKGGQDGRHRATAAKHEGIKKIPVVQWDKRARGGSIVDRALMLTSKKA